MKKKFWKLLALSIAVALIIYLALFANSMLGNPTQLAACPAARPLALPPALREVPCAQNGNGGYGLPFLY